MMILNIIITYVLLGGIDLKKKIIVCSIIILLTLLLFIFSIQYYNLFKSDRGMLEYKKSSYVVNVSPYYDIQHLVDYEGSLALEFGIDKNTGLEIGNEIIVSIIKEHLNKLGVDISSSSIRNNIDISIVKAKYLKNDVYIVSGNIKKFFIFSKQDKLWNTVVENVLYNSVQVVIDKSNGMIYKCVLNEKEVEFTIDEECALRIAIAIVNDNYMMNSERQYIENITSVLYDANGVARENEDEDSFYQICIKPRVSLNYLISQDSDNLLSDEKLVNTIKYNYCVLMRKRNTEIVKIWRY